MTDHMHDAAQRCVESRENIAKAIAYDLENGPAHGARISTSPHLDNYHIDGHVNLLALADAVLHNLAAQPPAAPVDLTDPVVVHVNMLRGTIAKPTWEHIKHLYPEQFQSSAGNEHGLLACPFCGPGQSMVDPWFDDVSKRWAIGCGRCGASSGRSIHAEGSKEAAIKSWNTRGLMPHSTTLNEIGEALESRGYAHMTNGRDIGLLLDELERLRTLNEPQTSGVWQSMATAPKDGAFLVWVPENLCIYEVVARDGNLSIFGGGFRDNLHRATHWMHLPASPVTRPHGGGK